MQLSIKINYVGFLNVQEGLVFWNGSSPKPETLKVEETGYWKKFQTNFQFYQEVGEFLRNN